MLPEYAWEYGPRGTTHREAESMSSRYCTFISIDQESQLKKKKKKQESQLPSKTLFSVTAYRLPFLLMITMWGSRLCSQCCASQWTFKRTPSECYLASFLAFSSCLLTLQPKSLSTEGVNKYILKRDNRFLIP